MRMICKLLIKLPKMEPALALDARKGNTLWADAIYKELENVEACIGLANVGDFLCGIALGVGIRRSLPEC